LGRFEKLLQALGNPQNSFQSIHVAGTKGKGSTCIMAADILSRRGLKVGLYTSPHILDVRERVALVAGGRRRDITKKDFAAALGSIRPFLEQARLDRRFGPPTYFEVLTAIALYFFKQQRVDCAVLETGLGGRLDATNAVRSAVSGITPISVEHTNILGKTLAGIASEKAGIIKTGQTVLVAPQKPAALRVIKQRCRQVNAKMILLGKDIVWQRTVRAEGQQVLIRTPQGDYDVALTAAGDHQAMNLAMAVGLADTAFIAFSWRRATGLPADRHGDGRLLTMSPELPGRFEIVRRCPAVILDGAHTPESIAAVGETIKEGFPGRGVTAVLGLAEDKDQSKIIKNLLKFSLRIILTRSRNPRAADFDLAAVRKKFPAGKFLKTPDVKTAMALALKNTRPDDIVLVAGSFYLVGEMKRSQSHIVTRLGKT